MSAEIYLKKDIANALLASVQAARETASALGCSDRSRLAAYEAGYKAAISTVALFFGISPGLVLPEQAPAEEVKRLPQNRQ